GGNIGHHHAIGPGDKTQQTVLGQNLARDNVTPLALVCAHRVVRLVLYRLHQASAGSSPSPPSSAASSSTSSSIQPALTRAFMMMALASSLERLKLSSAPGTRTRSLSLPVSK